VHVKAERSRLQEKEIPMRHVTAIRFAVLLAGALACVAVAGGMADAHPEEGSGGGSSPPRPYPVVERPSEPPLSPKLELRGHLPLPGPNADLWAHKNTVYIGSIIRRGIGGARVGVKLIDIADPTRPSLIGSLPLRAGTSYEDLMVISVDTPTFKGDLLAIGLQESTNGVEFWDVTDPRQPRFLSLLRTTVWGAHELFLLQREGRVLALLATTTAGLRIVDATDPTQPKLLSTWRPPGELKISSGLGVWPLNYAHSVSANAEGTIAYLSYWDAGAILLDIADPARPRYLGRTLYPVGEEGETHSAVDADGGRLLITTDEDLDPTPAANTIRVTAPASLSGPHPGIELVFTPQLAATGPIHGEVVYAGSGLPRVDYLADPKGKIALLDPGSDTQWRSQVRRAQDAGAVAVLFTRPQLRSGPVVKTITIPGVSLAREAGDALKAALAAGEKVEVELVPGPATWGFLRLWDIRDRAKPVPVGTFATPATHQFPLPRHGWFTAHNPVVRGDRLYVSWYADGVRVLDITTPAQPREIGHFVPPFIPGASIPSGPAGWFGPWPMVLGVVEHHGLILLSDVNTGLWILRDLPR
jgi:hypothetical protein